MLRPPGLGTVQALDGDALHNVSELVFHNCMVLVGTRSSFLLEQWCLTCMLSFWSYSVFLLALLFWCLPLWVGRRARISFLRVSTGSCECSHQHEVISIHFGQLATLRGCFEFVG